MKGIDRPRYPALLDDLDVDVCVVGAGIAGLMTAYFLSREGKSVAVLEDARVGGRMTERTTAHLSYALDDRYYEIERLHGARGAKLAAESHRAAIYAIESVATGEGIDCDFERRSGYLFVPPGESTEILERELAAAQRAGISQVERLERAPLASFDTGPCLHFPEQAQFHPTKFLVGVARAITNMGGRIFEDTHVTDVEGDLVRTKTGGRVTCRQVVIATNVPITDVFAIHTKQAPYTSYVIAARIPGGAVAPGLYWDTLDPYHYVRTQRTESEGELLIVGGEDQKTGHADDADERYARLETWMRERFPQAGEIAYRWSGQVMEPHDGMAFIGRDPGSRNVYIATGDSGHGLTHGTIAGLLLRDLILDRKNEWESLYDPSRKSIRSLPTFVRENLDVAADMGKWLSGGDVASVDEIEPGQGAIVRRGLAKLAVYRDENGKIHERSAACPHLGCVVAWNSDEKTWDCPCHGSRFDRYGTVETGPSRADLAEVEKK